MLKTQNSPPNQQDKMIESYFNYTDLLGVVSSQQALTVYLSLFLVLLLLLQRKNQTKYAFPPGPTGVPVLGYLPFLGREPFKKLNELKKKYGSVFSINMGFTRVVVLGDFEAVSDVFKKPASTGRPQGMAYLLPDSTGFGNASGEEWSEQRKFCVKSMRGNGVGRDGWESTLEMEVSEFVDTISSYNGRPLHPREILMSSISNNISTFVFGKRLPLHHPDRTFLTKAIDEMFESGANFNILAYFRVLGNISGALGIESATKMRQIATLFNNFFRKQTEKMKESYKNSEEENFIVDYLKEMDNHKEKTGHYFNESNLFGNIQLMFLAGSDSVSVILYWLFLAMAKFPELQTKVQQEIDSVLEEDGRIQWSDKKKLPYTYATILEAQRWRTVTTLGVARMATEDIQIDDYVIPKGTPIIPNFWALHNDPNYWKEPEKFEPERFLTEDGKEVISKPDSYVPFSYGKRNCPGEVVAMMELLIYFTSIMQKFTIMAPEGKILNLDGIAGLSYRPYSQELQFVPREK